MKKYFFRLHLIILTMILYGCASDQLGLTPTPPKGEVGKLIGELPTGILTLSSGATDLRKEPAVTIMNDSSGIITVWALAPNNWLWGYSPHDSASFGNVRNWYVLKNSNGSVSFKNAELSTCISAHGNGIVHIGCNINDPNQQFDLLLLTNGSVAIKNAENQRCLSIPRIRTTVYMPISFTDCVKEDQNTVEQQWFIAPPIQRPFPIPTQG